MGQGKGKGCGKEDSLPDGITFYKQVTFYKTFRLTTYKAVGFVIANPTREE